MPQNYWHSQKLSDSFQRTSFYCPLKKQEAVGRERVEARSIDNAPLFGTALKYLSQVAIEKYKN